MANGSWSKEEIAEIRKKAMRSDSNAQALLGALYASGSVGNVNRRLAFKWYSRAASSGLDDAQFNLGLMYLMGEGVRANRRTALRLIQAAARNGYVLAEETLGQLYEEGAWGIRRNTTKALHWYELAAKHGHARAKFGLGRLYVARNLPDDHRRGMQLIRQAAKAGVVAAKDYLRRSSDTPGG